MVKWDFNGCFVGNGDGNDINGCRITEKEMVEYGKDSE